MPERDTQDRVTQHRGVGAAEKRAQLGEEWPTCECHDVPLLWHMSRRHLSGGWFHCAVREHERSRTPKYRARKAAEKRKAYATDPEYRARTIKRVKQNYLRVYVGGMSFRYRVAPDKKEEIQERLAAFREDQARTRKEMADNGWIY